MNSREKGKRGERLWRDELCAAGFTARRGQQFSGSADSPDVICAELSWIHFEVKCVERLNIEEAMEQARIDCGSGNAECGVPKTPVVAHKRSRRSWLVTMEAEVFFRLVRSFEPRRRGDAERAKGGSSKPRMAITPQAWAGDDPSGELKTESGKHGGPKPEDEGDEMETFRGTSGEAPHETREARVLPETKQTTTRTKKGQSQ